MSEVKKSGFATAGLVVGIVGISLSFIPVVNNAAFVLGVLAVVFSMVAFVKKASIGKSVAAVILGILAIIITIVMQNAFVKAVDDAVDNISSSLDNMTGDNTDEIMDKYLEVTFGEFEVKKDTFLTETQLTVKIKNKSNENKSFSVGVEAVDENGTRIETDTVYVDSLGAGQTQSENMFTLLTEEKREKLKNAEFRVYEASMY
ncbi:MAG: DUF4190 domain-containing protein [Clostridia bacterium]|nr:DUF4190 domain-containing protein [Clostridia bacterium]